MPKNVDPAIYGKLTATVNVKVTEEEREAAMEEAEEAGVSLSAWSREAVRAALGLPQSNRNVILRSIYYPRRERNA